MTNMISYMHQVAEGAVPWSALIVAFVVVFFLLLFREPVSNLIGRVSRGKLLVGVSRVELVFGADVARDELGRAVEKISPGEMSGPTKEKIERIVQEAAPLEDGARFGKAEVLWVDDRPSNNTHERHAFEAVGIRFTIACATEEALAVLNTRSFAAIISDMGRPPDSRAGYTLLDALRLRDDKTPFINYGSSRSVEHQNETHQHGGQGCTNRPEELFKLMTAAIIGAPIKTV